jgi:hypothetical protein
VQVVVDILGPHGPRRAFVVDVLEQVLAGQLLAAPDERREAAVDQGSFLGSAALASKAEPDRRAGDAGMSGAQRRQPEGAVQARVLLTPHPEPGQLEQRHDGREDLLLRQARTAEVVPNAATDPRQALGEPEQAGELLAVATSPEAGVVAILPPPAGVAPDRLDMAVRSGADPDVGPRRRDRDGPDSRELPRRANRPTADPDVREASARPPPANARPVRADVAQPARASIAPARRGGQRSGR